MNTKVEEALAVIASGVADRGVRIAWPGQSIAELDNAGKTLARYIAQQDATIARLTALASDTGERGVVVPEGFSLVPERIYVSPEAWEAASFAFGGQENADEDDNGFLPCTLWVGEIEGDDGNKTHGLHVSCDECPEEGSITLSEFPPAALRAQPAGGDSCGTCGAPVGERGEYAVQSAKAWAEGYRSGVDDERMSEANIGIAGFDAKVEPARVNPYSRTPPESGGQGVECEVVGACYSARTLTVRLPAMPRTIRVCSRATIILTQGGGNGR